MPKIEDLIKGKTIRDLKAGEEYVPALSKKLKASEYILFGDAFNEELVLVTKGGWHTVPKDGDHRTILKRHIMSQVSHDGSRLTADFLWFAKGDSLSFFNQWLDGLLKQDHGPSRN